MDRISITQAAAQLDVSRRTLERWIRDGRLSAIPDPKDGRQRLVDPEAVKHLVAQMPKKRTIQQKHLPRDDQALVQDDQPTTAAAPPDDHYQEAIDTALSLAYWYHRRLAEVLSPLDVPNLTLEELREGALGQDLRQLADIAQGRAFVDQRHVLQAIDAVLQVLFWPAAADDYQVPRLFWDGNVGRMLALAKYRAYRSQDLVSVDEASNMLGVTIPTIYRWMDDRTLNYVRDDTGNRTWIVRRDIEWLKRKAAELPTIASPTRKLAS